MGINLAWLAVRGLAKDDVLTALGLEDTGEVDSYLESNLVGGLIANGWYVVVDRTFGIYEEKWGEQLSARARVIAVAMGEGFMVSAAREWAGGRELWFVERDGNNGADTLETSGSLPQEFIAIRERQTELQRGASGVDHLFEVPIELADQIVGFRPDRLPLPAFRELRAI